MVEIVVVLVIVMIISGIAASILQSVSKGHSAPVTAATGGAVWRGIQAWRTEEGQGLLPAANLLLASDGHGGYGGGLVDGAGARTIRTWPETGKGTPVRLFAGISATVPATSTAWADGIVYYASADRRSGWMAAYSSGGRLIYQRGIAASATPVVPIG
jgi:hypothetical protein